MQYDNKVIRLKNTTRRCNSIQIVRLIYNAKVFFSQRKQIEDNQQSRHTFFRIWNNVRTLQNIYYKGQISNKQFKIFFNCFLCQGNNLCLGDI